MGKVGVEHGMVGKEKKVSRRERQNFIFYYVIETNKKC